MKYRVLIVDDSVVMRRIIRQSLECDPDIEVVGVAANGRIALAMVEQRTIDIIILDIEMPEMDGLQTVRELRSRGVRTPVIMFSTLTEKGALATLDALAAGADDCVVKPANVGSVQDSMLRVRLDVIPKIKALCWKSREYSRPSSQDPSINKSTSAIPATFTTAPAASKAALTSTVQNSDMRVDIVAIGTSTGGPNALAEVIPHLPANFPVPIVIVQHMPPTFTRFLAERLTTASSLLVREGTSGAPLEPGQAWIAPGDFHMNLRRDGSVVRLGILQSQPENSCRPSVDVLFRSVSEVFRQNVLAVVMTGMGQDGLRGCEHIKEARGQIIVQDEATSVVWGMPGFVARAGLADCILPLKDIAYEIVRRVNQGRHALTQASLAGSVRDPIRERVQGGEYGA
ncbi:MAG TPA: chemotaxis response regulator protein-glutamate methylesterase [Candidatus Saccharimonadales bacterium]|nr:chemotaxis response regulator protein-glutamate methylesterase [Candidatus Saccharimonadales bacterium]